MGRATESPDWTRTKFLCLFYWRRCAKLMTQHIQFFGVEEGRIDSNPANFMQLWGNGPSSLSKTWIGLPWTVFSRSPSVHLLPRLACAVRVLHTSRWTKSFESVCLYNHCLRTQHLHVFYMIISHVSRLKAIYSDIANLNTPLTNLLIEKLIAVLMMPNWTFNLS